MPCSVILSVNCNLQAPILLCHRSWYKRKEDVDDDVSQLRFERNEAVRHVCDSGTLGNHGLNWLTPWAAPDLLEAREQARGMASLPC